MTQPLITVGIPLYNHARYIEQALHSALSQDVDGLEVIVLDNASTDGSADLVRRHLDDPRLRLVEHPTSIGQRANIERCVELARGRYFAWLHSDDVYKPGHLRDLVAALERHPSCVLAYCPIELIDENGKVLHVVNHPGHAAASYCGGRRELGELLAHDAFFPPSAAVMRHAAVHALLPLDGELDGAGDWDLWCRMAAVNSDFAFIKHPSVGYRTHPAQDSMRFYTGVGPLLDHLRIVEKFAFSEHRAKLAGYESAILGLLDTRAMQYAQRADAAALARLAALHTALTKAPPAAQPLVSVVVTTYNRPELLMRAIRSVLQQTYPSVEIIVVNDCGPQVENLIAWAGADANIQYIRHGINRGLGAARNTALRCARGEIIVYLDDDDLQLPDHIATVVDALSAPDVDFVYTESDYVVEQSVRGEMHEVARRKQFDDCTYSKERLFVANYIPVNTWGHRRSIFDRIGGFDESLRDHEDWDFLLRVATRTTPRQIAKVTVEVRHRAQADNMLAARGERFHASFKQLYERHGDFGSEEVAKGRLQMLANLSQAAQAPHGGGIQTAWLHAGLRTGARTAILLHLHYAELWPELEQAIHRVGPCDLYISLTAAAVDVADTIRGAYPHAFIAELDNRGRDIAPRLELARRVRQAGYAQYLLLHGKKSPHLRDVEHIGIPFLAHRDGDRWRRELIASLVAAAPQVCARFAQSPSVGLIGPAGFWLPLRDDRNMPRVEALAGRMGRALDPMRDGYFAGSMFWCRPEALEPLLALDISIDDFEPEGGQTDATLAHAVERLFGLSTLCAGLEISDTAGTLMSRPAPEVRPWLKSFRTLAGDRDWADAEVRIWHQAGTLPQLALVALDNRNGSIAATRSSLEANWHPVKVIELTSSGVDTPLRASEALLAAAADWVGLIDASDTLAEDAVFRIACAIRQHPDWQLVYTDEDTLTADGQHVNPHCKPDFNLDYLRSLPYIGGLLLIRRDLFEALGGFDPAFEGAEDYDLVLRAWEHLQVTGAGEKAIGHVAEVLYHRAQGSGHTKKSVPEILATGQAALQAHFKRLGLAVDVQPGPFPPSYRTRWPLPEIKPLVSILVPTRNQLGFLQRCVESVIEKTKYPAYEIIVIDNDSDDADTCRYLDAIEAKEAELGGRLRVLRQPGAFNFSAMNNAAARAARGDYLLLLNNDTAALHDDWLDEMMGHAIRPDVGIVGAKLLYPDGKIQHAGVILGMRGPAEHPFINRPPEDRGYFGRAQLTQDLSAVTGACLLVRKSVYEQVGGLDETDFKVSYNDIDLCLKVREAGLRIVFTPFALLLHEGSASQKGKVESAPDEAKLKRFAAEKDAMYRKWLPQLAFDPAYNRHLSLASTDFLLDDQPCLSWDPEWRPRPRILVHPADREGCGEYRIISPMRALNRAGMTQGWETMRLFEPAEMQRMDPDVLVVQRQMEWPQIDAIERHGRYHRAFRVFEIDDLITNLPVKSVHKGQIHKDIAKRFRKAAGLCHRLVVATEPLAQAYAGFADEVVVCPNHVEGARWGQLQPPRAERAKPRVGWAGGIGHTGDLELIADVVRDTAAEVDWVFFGMCPDSLKGVVKEFHPGVPLDQYAAKLASLDLDLAVAPLEDNPFNDAKSHLRLLEYGILGYPVICSDLTPYQGDFPVTRVANRYRDWMRAIRDALADRDALRAQGDALRDKVRAEWVLEDHLDRWMKAWTP